MIVNCGQLGLDWREVDLSDYLEAMEAHNEANTPKDGKLDEEQTAKLTRFNAAHGVP